MDARILVLIVSYDDGDDIVNMNSDQSYVYYHGVVQKKYHQMRYQLLDLRIMPLLIIDLIMYNNLGMLFVLS
jgi:hypothetical protein